MAAQLAVVGIAAAFCLPKQLLGEQRAVAGWPLLRDCGCWTATILVLGAVCHDGRIYWCAISSEAPVGLCQRIIAVLSPVRL